MKLKYTTAPNARFWTFENDGWIKITLAPGQSLKCSSTTRDDEGASWRACQWTHDGDGVRRVWGWGGRDCDGYQSENGIDFAALESLHAEPIHASETYNLRPIARPAWLQVEPSRCRDQFAEAAGF